jgi:uncharacterized protein YlxW (UPF0749 family)
MKAVSQFQGRIEELNTRVAQLESANKKMRESNVKMQARVEQEGKLVNFVLNYATFQRNTFQIYYSSVSKN